MGTTTRSFVVHVTTDDTETSAVERALEVGLAEMEVALWDGVSARYPFTIVVSENGLEMPGLGYVFTPADHDED